MHVFFCSFFVEQFFCNKIVFSSFSTVFGKTFGSRYFARQKDGWKGDEIYEMLKLPQASIRPSLIRNALPCRNN